MTVLFDHVYHTIEHEEYPDRPDEFYLTLNALNHHFTNEPYVQLYTCNYDHLFEISSRAVYSFRDVQTLDKFIQALQDARNHLETNQ